MDIPTVFRRGVCPGRQQMATAGVRRRRCEYGSRQLRSSRQRPAWLIPARRGAWISRPTADCSARPAAAGIARWDAMTGSPLAPEIKDDATAFARADKGATYATGGSDGNVRLFDSATDRVLATFEGPGQSVAFSPDGRYLASAHNNGDVVIWDARGARQVGLLKGHREAVLQVVFSPDGRSLATAGKDHTVKLWSLAAQADGAGNAAGAT